jgi:sorting nexin-25
MAEATRPPLTKSYALPVFLSLAALALSSRLSFTFLLALPLFLVTGVLAVLVGEVWLSRWVERRVKARTGRGSGRGGSGGERGRGTEGRRPLVPPLYFTSPAAWSREQTKAGWEKTSDSSRSSFPGAPPFLTSAIDSLLSLILRDFVLKWYSNISDSSAFPNAVETTIRETLLTFSTRFATVDWTELLVARLLPLLTAHLENFRTAELSVHGRASQLGTPDTDDLDLFVASRYASEQRSSKLHPAVDVASTNFRPAEEEWLRNLIDSILPLLLPERELDSPAVRIMVREIVSCAVLLPIFEMLGDPDFYNRILDDKVRLYPSFPPLEG